MSQLLDLCDHIGDTVTIFTSSGGISGCGFTGVLMSVNSCFVSLITEMGTPPTSPFKNRNCAINTTPMMMGDNIYSGCTDHDQNFTLGSVCDIPTDKIVSFCRNAI